MHHNPTNNFRLHIWLLVFLLSSISIVLQAQLLPYNDATDAAVATIDMTPLQSYIGPLKHVIEKRNKAVVVFMDGSGNHLGSGTLIGPDLILTARHVAANLGLDGDLSSFKVIFGYERKLNGQVMEVASYPIIELMEWGGVPVGGGVGGSHLDYAIVKINGRPLENQSLINYGLTEVTPIKSYTPKTGDPIAIIGHPVTQSSSLREKCADSGLITSISNLSNSIYFRTGINGFTGSSGSGLLDQDGYLIGVYGASWNQFLGQPEYNGGGAIAIHDIIMVSPIIQNLCAGATVRVTTVGQSTSNYNIHASAGEYRGASGYIRSYVASGTNPEDFYIQTTTGGQDPYFNAFIRPASQSSRELSGINIIKTAVDETGRTYKTISYEYLPNDNDPFIEFSFPAPADKSPRIIEFIFGSSFAARKIDHQNSIAIEEAATPASIQPSVAVYPNPASTELHILSTRDSKGTLPVKLLNLKGEAVAHHELLPGLTSVINISHLVPGIYILNCYQSGTIISTHKIVKEQ
jgi:Trypsin-like peptidase domain/Secretion system C-terminal sorting domain